MEEKGSVHRISRESLPDWGRQDVKQQPVSWEKKKNNAQLLAMKGEQWIIQWLS